MDHSPEKVNQTLEVETLDDEIREPKELPLDEDLDVGAEIVHGQKILISEEGKILTDIPPWNKKC